MTNTFDPPVEFENTNTLLSKGVEITYRLFENIFVLIIELVEKMLSANTMFENPSRDTTLSAVRFVVRTEFAE